MKNALDQFYTKKEIADACWKHFTEVLARLQSAPTGTGKSALTGTGESTPTGIGKSAPTGKEESATIRTGESTPTGIGESTTTGTRESATIRTGESTPTGTRESATTGVAVEALFFIEPSAGTGAFYNLLPPQRRLGMDIEPKCEGVIAQDFFKVSGGYGNPLLQTAPRDMSGYGDARLQTAPNETAIIGNPPFGKRGKLAIAFFNHAAYLADTVAFIVPVNFRKWTVHKQLDSSMRFISKLALPREAFQLGNGKPYAVNTEFQIWTRGEANAYPDMRLHQPLPTSHPDFQMWQYNNTSAARKVFRNAFDFAVPCQGWQDYSRKETDEKRCERNKQWILLKAKNPNVLARLMCINYERLAQECATAVPGFRKGDLVQAYAKQKTSPGS